MSEQKKNTTLLVIFKTVHTTNVLCNCYQRSTTSSKLCQNKITTKLVLPLKRVHTEPFFTTCINALQLVRNSARTNKNTNTFLLFWKLFIHNWFYNFYKRLATFSELCQNKKPRSLLSCWKLSTQHCSALQPLLTCGICSEICQNKTIPKLMAGLETVDIKLFCLQRLTNKCNLFGITPEHDIEKPVVI